MPNNEVPRFDFELSIRQTFQMEITIMDPDDPANELDITGWTARCAFRGQIEDDDELFDSSAVVTSGSGGVITCSATASEVQSIGPLYSQIAFAAEVESPTGRVVPAVVSVVTVVRSAIA